MQDLKAALLGKPDIRDLALFRRQYLQRLNIKQLTWPSIDQLRLYNVQEWIWLFVSSAQKNLAYPAYDKAFLKMLQTKIEEAVEGTDEPDAVDGFAELYSELNIRKPELEDQYAWIQYSPPWTDLDPSRPEQGICVLEKPNVLSSAGSTGHRTWEAALHFAYEWLEDSSAVRGKRVLELGAGTGFLSLVAAKQGAASVVTTDGDPLIVERAEQAARINSLSLDCKHYTWGEDIAELGASFDVVLATDVTYDLTITPHLIETFQQLVKKNEETAIWVCATKRNMKTIMHFRDQIARSGCLEVKALHECYGPEAQRGFFHTSTNVPFVIMLISGNASKRTDIDMYPLSRNYTAQ